MVWFLGLWLILWMIWFWFDSKVWRARLAYGLLVLLMLAIWSAVLIGRMILRYTDIQIYRYIYKIYIIISYHRISVCFEGEPSRLREVQQVPILIGVNILSECSKHCTLCDKHLKNICVFYLFVKWPAVPVNTCQNLFCSSPDLQARSLQSNYPGLGGQRGRF